MTRQAWKRAGALLMVVFLGLIVYTILQVKSVEREALQLATSGRTAIAVLSRLAEAIKAQDLEAIAAVYAPDYSHEEGRWSHAVIDQRDSVTVSRWSAAEATPTDLEGVLANYDHIFASVGSVEWSKGKLARVESMAPEGAVGVQAVLWLRGTAQDGQTFETQIHLELGITGSEETGWAIARQQLTDGTMVSGPGSGFDDRTAEVGLDFSASLNPRFSDPDWRLEKFGIAKHASAGVSAVDYDGDGWYDLYFGDGSNARLYRNETAVTGALTFRDVTADVGLPVQLPGINLGLFADLDNDGDKDLFLGRFMDGNRLYRNDSGAFVQVEIPREMARSFVTVAAAADYDGDGLLDLYLGRYLDARKALPTTLFYTRNGQGNSLLRNEGDLTFRDVTETAGVREGGLALGTSWADYDRDGDPDLHVANDFGRNALLRNEGDGTFADVSEEAGALDFGFGMSSSWGDVDNDGDLDLYVSNVHSGQRWYGQAATLGQYLLTSVKQGTFTEDLPLYREIHRYTGSNWKLYGDDMVDGNTLLFNDGAGGFVEGPEIARTNPYGWYWGSALFDYDNDGRLDIYAANGWISGETFDDL